MATIQELERALIKADQAGNTEDAKVLADAIRSARQSEFPARAVSMSPTELSVARSKNDAFGAYLRDQAQRPRPGETEDERGRRLYGRITDEPVPAVEGMGRAALQGASFGAGDELVAAGAAGLDAATGRRAFSDAYDAYLQRERERLERFRDESPVAAIGTEIAGAIPTAIATGGGAAPGLMRNMGVGAGQGATYGFLAGEGGERAGSAGTGALLGGGVALAAPAVGNVAKSVADTIRSSRVARQSGLSRPALNVLRRTMTADEALTGSGAQRIAQAGDDAMVADSGPAASGLLDTAIQRSGAAGAKALRAVDDRAARASQRVTGALDDALGRPGESASRALTVYGDRSNPIRKLYDRAYAQPIDYASDAGREIERLVTERVPQTAIRRANELMRLEGERSGQILAQLGDDGSVRFLQMPDVRQIDYITRGLNDVAKAQEGQGAMGGITQVGRAYQNLSRRLRDSLKEAVPQYRAATNAAAGPIRERQAREVGETLLRAGTTRSAAKEAMEGMGDAERRRVAEGVRTYIDDTLANVRRTLTDENMDAREAAAAIRTLSSRANQDKLAGVIGKTASKALMAEIEKAARAVSLRANVARNSATFARQAMDEVVTGQTDEGIVNALRNARPIEALEKVVSRIFGQSATSRTAAQDAVYEEIADFLTRRRGADAARAVSNLETVLPSIDATGDMANRIAQNIVRRNTGLLGPASNRTAR